MTVDIRLLQPSDTTLLDHVAADVFDDPVDPRWAAEFFRDPRHHLAVAIDDGMVVGMASAVHYVHPDKPPQLFINEVGVAASHHRRGIARQLLDVLLQHGRRLDCTEAWVLTDESNAPARQLYEACGGAAAPEPSVMYTFPLRA
ncbi:MAG TPA: GNAT family N-acetyltransferase [Gemmatimonadaceae bacterium]|nr:GNAT family N-acetyltransferase [Gemmatimonadaceae bacterium]